MKNIYLILIYVLIASVFFSSCSNQNEHIKLIPADSKFVISIDGNSLAQKGQIKKLKENATIKNLFKDFENNDKENAAFVKSLINTPAETGIDFNEKLYFYTLINDRKSYTGLNFKIQDQEKYKSFISKLFAIGGKKIEIKKEEKFNYVKVNRELIIAWKDKVGFSLAAMTYKAKKSLKEKFTEIIKETEPAKKLIANSKFQKFITSSKDINFWVSGKLIEEIPNYNMISGFIGDFGFEECNIQAFLSFNNDEINLLYNLVPGEKYAKLMKKYPMFKKGVNKDILKYIPNKSYGCYAFSLNLENYFKFITELPAVKMYLPMAEAQFKQQFGTDIKSFISSFSGDLVVNASDVTVKEVERKRYDYEKREFVNKMVKEPSITFEGIVGFNNKELIEKIMKLIPEGFRTKVGNYYSIANGFINLYYGYNENSIMITNNKKAIENHTKTGLVENINDIAQGKEMASYPAYGYMNLNLKEYPKAIQEEISKGFGRDFLKAEPILNNLKDISFKSSDANTFEVSLKFNTNGVNSLSTIVKTIEDNLSTFAYGH